MITFIKKSNSFATKVTNYAIKSRTASFIFTCGITNKKLMSLIRFTQRPSRPQKPYSDNETKQHIASKWKQRHSQKQAMHQEDDSFENRTSRQQRNNISIFGWSQQNHQKQESNDAPSAAGHPQPITQLSICEIG